MKEVLTESIKAQEASIQTSTTNHQFAKDNRVHFADYKIFSVMFTTYS
jgi:hypothetical protein